MRSRSPRTALPKPGCGAPPVAATRPIRTFLAAGCGVWRGTAIAIGPAAAAASGCAIVPVSAEVAEQAVAPAEAEPSERLEALRRAIGRLPDRQRQVVLMHYLEETTVKQIAAPLSVSDQNGRRPALSGAACAGPHPRRCVPSANWKDAAMPVDLVSEDELRAALEPYRPDPVAFEAQVRERIEALSR